MKLNMRILPNLLYLRAFEAVSRHLNISKAADELFVTPSAVSQQIKALEEDLGVSLLDRSQHRIKLTTAGQEYALTLFNVFNILRQASTKVRAYKNKPSIRIGVHNTLGIKCLIPKLNTFYETYPNINIQLLIFHEQNSPTDVDIEIVYHEAGPTSSDIKLINDYLVAIQAAKDNKTLKKARMINVSSSIRHEDWPRWLKAAKIKAPETSPITFRETMQAIEAAKNGLGIFVTHYLFVKEELDRKTLKLAHPLKLKIPQAFYLKANEDVQKTPYFAAVKEWLIAHVFLDKK